MRICTVDSHTIFQMKRYEAGNISEVSSPLLIDYGVSTYNRSLVFNEINETSSLSYIEKMAV